MSPWVVFRQATDIILKRPSTPLGLGDEKLMYSLLEALGATVISVGNRPSLLPFHTRVLRLKGEDGAWAVETPEEAATNAE